MRRKLKLFVIDDHADCAASFEALFSLEDIECQAFESFESALDAIKIDPPDAILSDVHMPGMPIEGFVGAVRAANPSTKVFVMSGDHRARSTIKSIPTEAFFLKPFDPKEVLSLVKELQH